MAINQKTIEQGYTKGISEEKPNEALQRATDTLGTEQGTELYNEAQAEVVANSIISNHDYLYKTGTEKYNKEMGNLASNGLTLSKEYNDKKESILNNGDLTVEGKTKQLKELYNTYNQQTKETIQQQIKLRAEHNKNRGKVASETLELIENKASINDFSEKDLNYILYMVNSADNTMLLGLLEQYNYNPFLINIINARDSKVSNHKDGKLNSDKLQVVHPLEYIRINKGMINNNELYTDLGTRTVQDLIPSDGIPGIDPWANISDNKTDW